MEEIFLRSVFLVVGPVIGSFLNVVIYRLPRAQNIAWPASHCPECQTPIAWYHNIPIISFLLLRGRCANCCRPISWRYPLVEAGTAVSFLMAYESCGLTVYTGFVILFIALLIALALIDLQHQILPDPLTLGGAILFLGYSFFNPHLTPLDAWLSAAGSAGLFLLLMYFYLKVRHIEGLGMGDVKMMLLLGAFLGYERLIIAVFLSSLSGLLVGIYFIAFRKKNLQFALPFGTFLAMGSYVTLFWGQRILVWMQSLFIPK